MSATNSNENFSEDVENHKEVVEQVDADNFEKDETAENVPDDTSRLGTNDDSNNKWSNKVDSTNEVDDDDDSRKLFVGGLSWETTEDDLKSYFESWGKVTHCVIKLDKMTGNSRGFGFVTMESEEVMRRVLEVSEHRLKNKKIDPKSAKPTKEPNKKIFVGGLSPDVSEDQIKEFFSQYGNVESVDLPFDTSKGKRKPYVFLSFTTEEAAKNAILIEKQDVFGSKESSANVSKKAFLLNVAGMVGLEKEGTKCDVRMAVPKDQVNKNKMTAWGNYNSSMYPPGSEYYSYEYPYSYDPNAYYSSYYGGYPYGYSYPMPPQPYVVPPRAPGSAAGGKMTARGRGGAGSTAGNTGGYHPYSRQQ